MFNFIQSEFGVYAYLPKLNVMVERLNEVNLYDKEISKDDLFDILDNAHPDFVVICDPWDENPANILLVRRDWDRGMDALCCSHVLRGETKNQAIASALKTVSEWKAELFNYWPDKEGFDLVGQAPVHVIYRLLSQFTTTSEVCHGHH